MKNRTPLPLTGLFAGAIWLCGMSVLAFSTSFTEDFSDHSPAPHMVLGAGYGTPLTDFSDDFTITSGTNHRIYLGTHETDYSQFDFAFEATVTVPNDTNPWAIAFFGMGKASATGSYGEPAGPNTLLAIRNDSNRLESRDNGSSAVEASSISGLRNNSHRLRMEWDSTTQWATFFFDNGNNGSFDYSFSIDGSNNTFDASNSQLLLGGGNGLSFDNIVVSVAGDLDGDGLPDTYELEHTTPASETALNPADDLENGGAGDGLTNLQEYQHETDPNNPDSDADTLLDGDEVAGAGARPATSPTDDDSDDDGLPDGVESNTGIFLDATDTGTDPTRPDTDSDSFSDAEEISRSTDPTLPPWHSVPAKLTYHNGELDLSWMSQAAMSYNVLGNSGLFDDTFSWPMVAGNLTSTAPTNLLSLSHSAPKQFFTVWEFPSPREHHVAVTGSDTNNGTSGNPFQTISAAAAVAAPGDIITVHGGIYRERISPPRGGVSDAIRITYQAAPREQVEIKGSEIITGWVMTGVPNLWEVTLPNSFFGDFNPYNDLIEGDYITDTSKNQHTGMIYLNGTPLEEAADLNELNISSNSPARWFGEVSATETTLQAWFTGVDPNNETVEINVRQSVFYPSEPYINYITVRGFEMSQAAPNWAPPTAEQVGLIGTHWSKGWIIESNTISHARCTGVTLGKYGDEYDNTYQNNSQAFTTCIDLALKNGWNKETVGSHLVRDNTIRHCGQAGIVGSMGAAFSTLTGNLIHDIAKDQRFGGYETAGIKFHGPIDTTINNNHIYNCGGFGGIWLDWMTQGTRFSGNLMHDNSRDLFVEVNHGPFLVDHNIFLSPGGLLEASGGGAYVHNLFSGNIQLRAETRLTPFHTPHHTETLGLAGVAGDDERFFNNLFVDYQGLSSYNAWTATNLQAVGNVYTAGAAPSTYDSQALVYTAFNPGINLTEEPDGWWLELSVDPIWLSAQPREIITSTLLGHAVVSGAPFENPDGTPYLLNHDYTGLERAPTNPAPGPFKSAGAPSIRLKVWPIN